LTPKNALKKAKQKYFINSADALNGDGGKFEGREELNVLNTRGINSITSIPSNLVFTTPNSFAIEYPKKTPTNIPY